MFPGRTALCAIILALCASSCKNAEDTDCGDDATESDATDCPSAKKSPSDPDAQDLAPVPGEGPTFSNIAPTTVTVTWTEATDTVTPASKLEYQLVSSDSAEDLEEISTALAAKVVLSWSANTLSSAVSGLKAESKTAFNVLVRDEGNNIVLYTPATVTSLDPNAPMSDHALAFSQVTDSGFSVSWTAATSTVTSAANLEYRGVIASSLSAIDEPSEVAAMSGSSVLFDWTKARLTHTASGLTSGATYAVAVLVRDSNGVSSLYGPTLVKTLRPRLIFMTASTYTPAQLSPSSAADAFCNASKPANRGNFKAMIVASDRSACTSNDCVSAGILEHTDWVMDPLTAYENASGSLLWTTNGAGIVPGNPTHPAIFPAAGNGLPVWTGLATGWRNAADNCQNWTSTAGGSNGSVGIGNYTDSSAWTFFSIPCNQSKNIYCVEQ